jgi:hypothetical protein
MQSACLLQCSEQIEAFGKILSPLLKDLKGIKTTENEAGNGNINLPLHVRRIALHQAFVGFLHCLMALLSARRRRLGCASWCCSSREIRSLRCRLRWVADLDEQERS